MCWRPDPVERRRSGAGAGGLGDGDVGLQQQREGGGACSPRSRPGRNGAEEAAGLGHGVAAPAGGRNEAGAWTWRGVPLLFRRRGPRALGKQIRAAVTCRRELLLEEDDGEAAASGREEVRRESLLHGGAGAPARWDEGSRSS
ncbi:hypothetical protein ACQJBY_064412 [Aegilops geniculata]